MIGQAPDCETSREMFDWPDAVVQVKPDGSDFGSALSSLMAKPDRILEISRRDAEDSLLRHGWVNRWKRVLEIAELRPAHGMHTRERRLRELAEDARTS